MNVRQLIEDLSKFPPDAPVRVCPRSVYWADESGESMQTLCENDAAEADEVRGEGGFVLIWGGKS